MENLKQIMQTVKNTDCSHDEQYENYMTKEFHLIQQALEDGDKELIKAIYEADNNSLIVLSSAVAHAAKHGPPEIAKLKEWLWNTVQT